MRSARRTRGLGLLAGVAALTWTAAGPAVADGEQDGRGSAPATGLQASSHLQLAKPVPVSGVKPGDDVPLKLLVRNSGDGPADRTTLYIGGSQGLAFVEKYSNCVHEDVPAQDEGPAQVTASCSIEQVLEPGVVYGPEEPIVMKLQPRALYDWYTLHVDADSPVFPNGSPNGSGRQLRLVAQNNPPAGVEFLDSLPFTHVTAENTADFSLTGAKIKAEKGETVSAEVTFTNKGPAWVDNDAGSPIGVFDVGIPAGTTVTGAPDFCTPIGSGGKTVAEKDAEAYRCTTPYDYVDENTTLSRAFELHIDTVVPNATGKVGFVRGEHRSGTLPFDPVPGNNTAAIVVNASGTGGTSGGNASAGEGGSGSEGATSGATASGGGSAGSTGGGTAAGASVSGGGTQPELAESGVGAGPLIAAAAGLLGTGGVALAVTGTPWRSRRRPSAAESAGITG
ncbi:hypothetical protein [uncultured Streptomyces sp.]|uniref:hypothetical protein n=1 Tax=uncultured Streptomyces sp. TaxID=174707 RepID=UPI002625D8AD|nr:hypothetical protein [uncultured Streptomyces sp.]